jgi:DNA-binding IclR family transcriptional regulator
VPKRALPHGASVPKIAPETSALVKSAGRVLRVLEFFDEIQREARVSEVAEGLAFPQSSTSVLLKCMADLGYLDFEPETRTFLPSPRVSLLGSWLDKGPIRSGSLTRLLEDLSDQTGHTVILATRNGIYSQYIHVIQARRAMRFHVPPGSRRLVVWSATGFALLTGASEKEVRALCTRTNAEMPEGHDKVVFHRSYANIKQTTQDGFFFSKGLVTPGAGSIAAPLPSLVDQRDRRLVVALSGPLNEFSRREKHLVRLLIDTVARYLQ